jgi:serine/threonine protein kinase
MQAPDPSSIGGMRLGRYELIRPIGEGGMAQVYLCVRRGAGGFQKQMVLKVLHSRYLGDRDVVDMFLEEARLLARLRHPNIVDVSEVECVDGVPYMAMEYIDGPTIGLLAKQASRAGESEFGFFLHLVRQVCEALRAAHELRIDGQPAGLVHRDVSSQNVLVDATTGVAKLIDFGVAKANDTLTQTQIGVVKGKIHYLAPEVLGGARPDVRTDLYAVGVLLYRLVTGRLPFREADLAELAGGNAKTPFVPLSSVAGLPEGVAPIIMRALAYDPDERYQTAAELSADLGQIVDRLRIDPNQIPTWIRRLFPETGGTPPSWAEPTRTSAHTTLTRLVSESSSFVAPVQPRVARAAASVGLAGAMVALLTLGLVAWLWVALGPTRPGPPSQPSADAELYLKAAQELAEEGDIERAIFLNQRAADLNVADAELVVRIARQRSDLERKRQHP